MNIAEIRAKFPQYADVPDGELVRGLHKKFYADVPYPDFLRKIDFAEKVDPTKDMGHLERFNAGMGKAFADLGRGASQLVGAGPSAEEMRDQKALDAPLTKTAAGTAGVVTGNIAALAPLAVAPGAATVAGAGTIGAITGGLQPTENAKDRIVNMLVGGSLGAGTQFAAGPGATAVGEWGARREAAKAAEKSQNAVRDATLKAGQEAGFTLPASVVNPTTTNKIMDSVAGKAAVGQEAAMRNQKVVDALARKEAGLRPEQAMSEKALRDARKAAAGPYRELTSISPQAAADMEALKQARLDSKLNWQDYNRNQTVAAYKEAQKADQLAESLENALEAQAASTGRPELVDAMREARKQIAKIHDVERSLNVGTGSVEAAVLGRMRDRGAPLSDGLKTIADFQQAYPSYMREASSVPTPGVSKVAAILSGGMGAGGFAAGGPLGAAAGAIPFAVPPAARSLSLKMGKTAANDYALTTAERVAAALADQATRDKVGMAARSMVLPAIPFAVGRE